MKAIVTLDIDGSEVELTIDVDEDSTLGQIRELATEQVVKLLEDCQMTVAYGIKE